MPTASKRTSFENVDSYIAAQPTAMKPILKKLRQIIRKAIPKAEEVISYQVPAYRYHGLVIFFAGFKAHYSIFVRPVILREFKSELTKYKTSKSGVNFPPDKPIPARLISSIAKYVASMNEMEAREKQAKSKSKPKSKKK